MVDVTAFEVRELAVDGLLMLRMKAVAEPRGVVREAFRASTFLAAGIYPGPWKQVNVTETACGAIRGFHGETAIKVVAVAAGAAFGAYLDARPRFSDVWHGRDRRPCAWSAGAGAGWGVQRLPGDKFAISAVSLSLQ